MHHLTLWLNMITLSVLVASGGLSFLRLLRIRARWQRYYLAYLGSYAMWLLFSTFTLFQRSYLLTPPSVVESVFAYARAGISVVMVIVGPLFYVTVGRQFATGRRRPHSSRRTEWIVIWAVAAVILALVVLMLVTGSPVYSTIGTNLFNLAFAVLSIRALAMVGGSPAGRHEPIRWFLWYSAVAHALIVAVSLALRLALAPDLYRDVESDALLAVERDADGRVVRLYRGDRPIVGAIARRITGRERPAWTGRDRIARSLGIATGWLGIAFFAGYASILVLAGSPSIVRSPLAVIVFNLPALLILLAVALGIAAVSAWKGRASLVSRIHLTLLSPAALALAWFAWQWNVLGYMG